VGGMNLRRLVEELSQQIAAGELDAQAEIDTALDGGDVDRAAALMLASLAAGTAPSTGKVRRVLPDLDDARVFGVLAGRAAGDRLEMLMDLLEEDAMGDVNDAWALFLTADLVGTEAPPPQRLLTLLDRRLSRIIDDPGALRMVDDAAVLLLRDDPKGPSEASQARRAELEKQRTAPLLEVVPEALRQSVPILPVQREGPRVGRNDACPCGSGLKYKKCHALRPAEAPQRSLKEQLRAATRVLSPEQVHELRMVDLVRLELSELRTLPLVTALYRFIDLRRWERAERALALLADRKELPADETVDGYRLDLVRDAMDQGRVDVAGRQMALVQDRSLVYPSDQIELELLQAPSPLLQKLDHLADLGLQYPQHEYLVELAFLLLRRAPALGIIAARGAISRDRLGDARGLLLSVQDIRARLGIKGSEPVEDLLKLYAKDPDARRTERLARSASTRDRKQAEARAAEFRRQLEEASRRMERLEKELEAARTEAAAPAGTAAAVRDLDAEKRLRTKVEELKGLIAEGNRERADLRHALEATSAGHPRLAEPGAGAAQDPGEASAEEALEEGHRPVGLLFPEFSTAARASLEDLPLRTSRAAIQKACDLAAGEPAAWGEAKRLQGVKDLLSARVGIHHRMLFRLEPPALRVEDVIHREGLMTVLKRWK
jgi:hypothetical protein